MSRRKDEVHFTARHTVPDRPTASQVAALGAEHPPKSKVTIDVDVFGGSYSITFRWTESR